MFFIGVDLHKRTLSVCVMVQEGMQRQVVARQTLATSAPGSIVDLLKSWMPFQLAVEASASHEWFVKLVELFLEKKYCRGLQSAFRSIFRTDEARQSG